MAVDEEAEVRYIEATLKRWRESEHLDVDAEIEEARSHLRYLREETIAEWTVDLDHESNPYHRQFLQGKIEEMRRLGEANEAAADPSTQDPHDHDVSVRNRRRSRR